MEAQELAQLARLIRGQRWAALGTMTRQDPLASMVAYAPEPDFSGFLMHLSQLSRHTKNLLANPHASLAISEPETGAENPQTLVRVSIQGEVDPPDACPRKHPGRGRLPPARCPGIRGGGRNLQTTASGFLPPVRFWGFHPIPPRSAGGAIHRGVRPEAATTRSIR
jgi:hypothetical protein